MLFIFVYLFFFNLKVFHFVYFLKGNSPMSLYLFRIHYLLYCFLLKIILKIWMEFKLFKKLLLLLFSNCHESTHSVLGFFAVFSCIGL